MQFPLILALALAALATIGPLSAKEVKTADGTVKNVQVTVGPFDLHRKYRSMEGPWVAQDFRLGDLAASEQITIPESAVTFVEGNSEAPSMSGAKAPSMAGGGGPSSNKLTGLVDTSKSKRELLWFKGVKLEVLDENGKVLPTAEFICHFNIDVDPAFRKKLFPNELPPVNTRVMTLTQGQTDFHFPEGTAVPCASDEKWKCTFQAANRTSTAHRRVKHRLTLEFMKDSQTQKPMKALTWFVPYIAVVTNGSSPEALEAEHSGGPNCMVSSSGDNAPNSVKAAIFKDRFNRKLTGHWVIPPGTSTWSSPINDVRDPGFAKKDMKLYAAWTHIHPLCTKSSLVQCSGDSKKTIFTSNINTKTKGGLEILSIENIYSKTGIPIKANEHYQLEATYVNPTNENLDSMVSHGLYVEDESFVKPDWKNVEVASATTTHSETDSKNEAPFCGVKNSGDSGEQICTKPKSVYDVIPPYPMFDPAKDGPILTGPRMLEIFTSAGKVRILLNPQLAPQNVTQIYKLLKAGAFDGTPIERYEPNFVLQVSEANKKVDGSDPLTGSTLDMLRRLPLEVPAQNPIVHKKGCLSMAHYDNPDTAVTSFSIMLGDAPHLDKKYTIIGSLVPDKVTLHTIEQMEKGFSYAHPFIMGVRDISDVLSTSASKPAP